MTMVWRQGLERPVPLADRGGLDLRSWDFSREAPIPLAGMWEFLPETLVRAEELPQGSGQTHFRRVPDTRFGAPGGFFSGTGGGTYRLKILLPPEQTSLGLRVSVVWSAYEVEVDGTILTRVGNPSEDPTREVPAAGPTLLPITPQSRTLDLVIRVSNHQVRWGGIATPPSLGTWNALVRAKNADDSTVFLFVGILGGTALFALFFFGFRRSDPAFASFAVFSLLVILRALVSGDRLLTLWLPWLSFDAFLRIHYLSLYLLIPTAVVFFAALFPEDISRRKFTVVFLLSLIPLPSVPWFSLPALSWEVLGFVVLYFGAIGYGYWTICLKRGLTGRPGAWVILAGGSVLLGVLLSNIRSEVAMATLESEFPGGLVAFVIVQALLLSYRSTWAFHQTELLTSELKRANQALAAETREAEEARSQVEATLDEKEILLKEVHHRVKNSLQIVLSIIGLETRRTSDVEVRKAYLGIRERILAITLVHERLYGMESEKQLSLGDYLADLTTRLGESFGEKTVVLEGQNDPLPLPMDLCLDIGLVVTELVIHSYRPGHMGPSGVVRVRVEGRENNALRIEVSDDGPGFVAGYDLQSETSAGIKIVSSLVKGRQGRLAVLPGPTARMEVWFGPLREV